ncbi:MAG: extracellular solute-binding protein [Candidatus Eisenbacteria bacterium]|nr:extracellular solute-binding protein [Candidatus Eisenbacteria bacterium]
MSARRLPLLTVIAMLASLLGACAKPGEDRREVVSVWSTVPAPSLAPWVARFEESSPRLRVVVRSFAEEGFADSIASALAAGKAPDLATLPSEALPALMGQGVLSDWSAGVADLRGTLRGWELCMLGDAIYGLPWLLDSRVLYYNVDRWKAAGGAEGGPRDAAALQKVAARSPGALGLAFEGPTGAFSAFEPWAFASGVQVGTPSLDTSRIVSDAAARTLSSLLVLRRTARVEPQAKLEDAFARGQLTMVVAGAELASRLAARTPALAHGAVLVPSWVPGAESRSFMRGTVLASFTTSRRKEDALRFARYLVEGDALARLARTLDGPVPASLNADTTAWAAGSPVRATLSRALDAARAEPVHPAWPHVKAGLDSLFTLAFTGGMPVAHALAAADTLIVSQARPR